MRFCVSRFTCGMLGFGLIYATQTHIPTVVMEIFVLKLLVIVWLVIKLIGFGSLEQIE